MTTLNCSNFIPLRYLKRFHHELKEASEIHQTLDSSISLTYSDSSPNILSARVQSPKCFPYSPNILLGLTISLPHNYPFGPPTLRVNDSSLFFHPHIDEVTGDVSLKILKHSFWVPCYSIYSICQEFLSLLTLPEIDDHNSSFLPNQMATALYLKSPSLWKNVVSIRFSRLSATSTSSTDDEEELFAGPCIRQKRTRSRETPHTLGRRFKKFQEVNTNSPHYSTGQKDQDKKLI